MTTNGNGKMGRPKINIDFKELEKLCHIQCSEMEIADWFHCTVDTVNARVKEKFGITFSEYFQKHRVSGKVALRRNLFKLAEKQGHVAIFMAKNWLGMKDSHEIAGDDTKPFKHIIEVVDKETKTALGEVINGQSSNH